MVVPEVIKLEVITCLKWLSVSGLFSHISVMRVTPVIKMPVKK